MKELIQTKPKFDELRKNLNNLSLFSVDTETNGKFSQFEVNMVGISFGWEDYAAYIPLAHLKGRQLAYDYVIEGIKPFLEDPSKEKIYHNAKFDETVIGLYGIDLQGFVYDTIVMQHLYNENVANKKLKFLVHEHFGYQMRTYEEVIDAQPFKRGQKKDYSFAAVPLEEAMAYAGDDAYWTYKLCLFLKEKLIEEKIWDCYKHIEGPLTRVVRDMEYRGVYLDQNEIEKANEHFPALLEEIESKIYEEVGEVFNVGSPKQLGTILFEKLEISKNPARTKSGQYVTDAKVLKLYASRYPAVEQVLRHRKAKKVHGTFVKGLAKYIQKDGKVHANFDQVGTDTGRFSCIAEGTLIDCPRDLIKYPSGVPIENIKEGDYVYSFNSIGDPEPRKVLKKRHTGNKKVIKIVWRAHPNNYLGELKLTPEHFVRTEQGWCRADQLKSGDKLEFLSRRVDKDSYSSLRWSRGRQFEHRVVCGFPAPQSKRYKDGKRVSYARKGNISTWYLNEVEQVHHKDTNKLNNSIDNLEVLSLEEHRIKHGELRRNGIGVSYKECPYTKAELQSILCNGILNAVQETSHDFLTLKRWAIEKDITLPDKRMRGVSNDEILLLWKTRVPIIEIANQVGISKKAVVSRVHRLRKKGVKSATLYNHSVVCIVDENETLPVWDLQIEGTHNFIANEIEVHNSNKPNLQNQKGDDEDDDISIRGFFTASPGYKLIIGDYSQVELRLLAHFSKDENMMEAFIEGRKIHDETARKMLKMQGKPLGEDEQVPGRQKFYAKTLNFGIPYGRQDGSVAEMLGVHRRCAHWPTWNKSKRLWEFLDPDTEEVVEQGSPCHNCGKCFIRDWYAAFPRIEPYKDSVLEFARKTGYVRTLSGRKRHLLDINSKDFGKRSHAERQAFNTKVQGSAGDLIKLAMVSLGPKLKPLDAGILMSIHDELVVEAPEEYAEDVAQIMKETMEYPFQGKNPISVPLVVEPTICNRWSEGK